MEHNETFNYDKLNKFLSYIDVAVLKEKRDKIALM